MSKFLILTALLTTNSFANDTVLLKFRREKPSIQCDITTSSVKITRATSGIKYTKVVAYQMSDLQPLIKEAAETRGDLKPSLEYFALSADSGQPVYFNLSAKDSKNLKLINLISELCELSYL